MFSSSIILLSSVISVLEVLKQIYSYTVVDCTSPINYLEVSIVTASLPNYCQYLQQFKNLNRCFILSN